jgi:Lrp/AsnC family leucine-responsive transcriptional regulator
MSTKDLAKALDRFDLAILKILQVDNKTPQRHIAAKVGLSAAAVQRRIATLEARGVITGNVALVNPEALGPAITVIVEVHLVDDQSSTIQAAKTMFAAAAEIQQCYMVFGKSGFILVIIVPDMKAYEALSSRLLAGNPLVSKFRTIVVLDAVKVGQTLNLPD